MHQLPEQVRKEFESGKFVVKRASLNFNKVAHDQSQEWLIGIGKKGGGIIGITKTSTAPRRWALSHMALETRALYGVSRKDDLVHNESTKAELSLTIKMKIAFIAHWSHLVCSKMRECKLKIYTTLQQLPHHQQLLAIPLSSLS